VTSALTRGELPRVVSRAVPPIVLRDRLRAIAEISDATHIIPVTGTIIAAAPAPAPALLDAIHEASAQAAKPGGRPAVVAAMTSRCRRPRNTGRW